VLFKTQPREEPLEWHEVENSSSSRVMKTFITIWQPIEQKINSIQLEDFDLIDNLSEMTVSTAY
jgi:hypothetical protein